MFDTKSFFSSNKSVISMEILSLKEEKEEIQLNTEDENLRKSLDFKNNMKKNINLEIEKEEEPQLIENTK